MHHVVRALFVVVGIVNVLPAMGVLGAPQLGSLYGLSFEGGDLVLLMRHRAVLLGLVGGLLVAAAFKPSLRLAAGAMGLASMLSFVVLALPPGSYGASIQRVVWVDVVAILVLVVALVLARGRRGGGLAE